MAGTCLKRGLVNRTAFNRRRTGRNTDNNQRGNESAAVVNLADEGLDHFFGNFEVGDHTVFHRADGFHRNRRLTEHGFRLRANRVRDLPVTLFAISHNRRLIDNHALIFYVNKSVRRTKVDGHIRRQEAKKTTKHILPPHSAENH